MPTIRHDHPMGRGATYTTVRILTRIPIPMRTAGGTIHLRYCSISDTTDSDLSLVGDSAASGAKGKVLNNSDSGEPTEPFRFTERRGLSPGECAL